jgi:hypothetical protein
MKASTHIVEIKPAVPAVTEERVALDLSVHEARVLRALFGKSNYKAQNTLEFLAQLNRLFPLDYTINYAGITGVTVELEN